MNSKKLDNIFILISILYLALVLYWLFLNDFTTAHVDDTNYLKKAFSLLNYSSQGFAEFVKGMVFVHPAKPPLMIYFLASLALVFRALGHEVVLSLGIVILNLFLLLNLNYFFKWVVSDKLARNWALVLFIVCPLVFSLSKLVMTEIILINFLLLTINLLKYFEGRYNFKNTLLLGLVFALGALSKATFLFFILCPILYYRKPLLQNYKAFLLGASLALPWYSIHTFQVFAKFFQAANFRRHTDGAVLDLSILMNYILDLSVAFGPLLLVLVLILSLRNIKILKSIFTEGYLCCILLVPFINLLFFCFINNKNERFQYVAFFFLLVLMAILISKSKSLLLPVCLISLQFALTFNLCFFEFLDLPKPRVLYMTRPYKSFFNKALKSSLLQLFSTKSVSINVYGPILKDDIEVEFQYKQKNPRSIDDHLELLKSEAAWVEDYLKEHSFKDLFLKGFIEKRLRPDYKVYDYELLVVPNDDADYSMGKGFVQFIELGESKKDKLKFLLFKKSDFSHNI